MTNIYLVYLIVFGGIEIKKNKLILLLIVFCFIFSISTVSAEYEGNTTYVDTLDSIKDVVAIANDGDTIYLNEGTYQQGGIIVDKNLTFIGNGAVDKVIIDANNKNEIFIVRDKVKVTFINITFINGYKPHGDNGAAIDSRGSTIYIDNCRFINNSAGYNGGAISNAREGYVSGYMVLTNSIFIGNKCVHDGGAVSTYLSESIIKNCQFYNNTAGRDGGAIRVKFSDYHLLDNCTFMYNRAEGGNGWGGAIYTWTDVDSYITNCYIVNNWADEAGGGITTASRLVAKNNTVVNNSAMEMGGGIYVYEEGEEKYSTAVVNDNDIYGNKVLKLGLTSNGGCDVYISDRVTEGNLLNFNNNYWGTNNPLNSTDYPYTWKDRFYTSNRTVILTSWITKKDKTKLEGKDISFTHDDEGKYDVTLLDSDGNPIPNQKVIMSIGDIEYPCITNDVGMASLDLDLNPGNYVINVFYNGNDDYYNSTTQNLITVIAKNETNPIGPDSNIPESDITKNDTAIAVEPINNNWVVDAEENMDVVEKSQKYDVNDYTTGNGLFLLLLCLIGCFSISNLALYCRRIF